MPSVTLAESAKLSQDMLVQGLIENVITVNPFYDIVPFEGIEGNSLAYNRENVLGDVQVAGVGDAITAKAAATFTQVTSALTTIVGDAEVNGLVQATRSNKMDQKATQIASKAKSAGRKYQDMLVNGTGAANQFSGMLALVDAAKKTGAANGAANGGTYDLSDLDRLIDLVTDKDGTCDFISMTSRELRRYLIILRALGGASVNEVVTLPSGRQVPAYRQIPIFKNDWIPVNQTVGTSTDCSTIFAGTLDDGSQMHGFAGLTAKEAAGLQVKEVGESETKDESITRVVWYCGLALFNLNGLAALTGSRG